MAVTSPFTVKGAFSHIFPLGLSWVSFDLTLQVSAVCPAVGVNSYG